MSITNNELDLYIENDLNVLFEGKHGVGKTAMVIEAFERNNLNWKYFSAATMDPWVDFVGIPRAIENGTDEPYIELTRPKGFHNDSVQAIFMDELNRAPKKVRNAVMELIQFKSINGVRFPNLKVIWAAINPEDEEESDVSYDVDVLDPAQRDRFHITVEIPYKPSLNYFQKAYGSAGEGAVEWWNALNDKNKELVSPRRLEYALKVNGMGGSLRHVLRDASLNTTKLVQMVQNGSLKKRLRELYTASEDEISQVFSNMNFATNVFELVIANGDYITRFIQYMPKDMVSDVLIKGDKTSQRISEHAPEEYIDPIMESLAQSEALTKAKKKKLAKAFSSVSAFSNALPPSMRQPKAGSFEDNLRKSMITLSSYGSSTTERRKALKNLLNYVSANAYNNIERKEAIHWLACIATFIRRSQMMSITKPGPSRSLLDLSISELTDRCNIGTHKDMVNLWDETKLELEAPKGRKIILKTNNRMDFDDFDFIENTGVII